MPRPPPIPFIRRSKSCPDRQLGSPSSRPRSAPGQPSTQAQWTQHRLIRSTRLHHKQVYTYRIHHGKLNHITRRREHQSFQPIADHRIDMAENCPHHLFQTTIGTDNRASQGKAAFNLDSVEIKAKRNHACRIADLVLQTVTNNKRRHDEIQRFMLITDSVTVAVEVPIILTPEDIADMQRQLGFHTQKLHLEPKSP